jgi:hypothetical protein
MTTGGATLAEMAFKLHSKAERSTPSGRSDIESTAATAAGMEKNTKTAQYNQGANFRTAIPKRK